MSVIIYECKIFICTYVYPNKRIAEYCSKKGDFLLAVAYKILPQSWAADEHRLPLTLNVKLAK